MKYIETNKTKIRCYKNNLFEFSYNSFNLGNNKICEFLVSIGTIIDEYDKIITNENTNNYFNNNNWYKKKQKGKNNNKQVSVIKTIKMRKNIRKIYK